MIPFNYHHLYYFYTIARLGSIAKACDALRLSQPTLSAQLKQFENYFKIKLFDRENKKLILTEEGRRVLFYATEIFNVGAEMIDNINDMSQKGRIKIQIGISHHVPRSVVDALLKFLLKIEPGVYISLHEENAELLSEGLKTHQLDIALSDSLASVHTEGDLECRLLAEIPVVFCAHPALAKKFKQIPQDLNGAPVILPTAHSQVYLAIQDYFVKHKIKPKIVGEIQELEIIRRLVLAGAGIAPLNKFTVMQSPGKESIKILGTENDQSIFDKVYMMTKTRKKKHPLIPAIIDRFRISAY
jgi:LysR family transcriptional activator of nhaA